MKAQPLGIKFHQIASHANNAYCFAKGQGRTNLTPVIRINKRINRNMDPCGVYVTIGSGLDSNCWYCYEKVICNKKNPLIINLTKSNT